jgi:hypothetical protein
MMVAIPGLLMAHVVKRRRNEYVAFLARLEGITLRHFRPRFRGEMTGFFVRKKQDQSVESLQGASGARLSQPQQATTTPPPIESSSVAHKFERAAAGTAALHAQRMDAPPATV